MKRDGRTGEVSGDRLAERAEREQRIRHHVAERARARGDTPRPADVVIAWSAHDLGPSAGLFLATWVGRSGSRGLAGVWIDDQITTHPDDAIDMTLRRWRALGEGLPDADTAASACALLLDADRRHRPLLGPVVSWPATIPAEDRLRMHRPRYEHGDPRRLLVFWWLDPDDVAVRVEIGRREDGRIVVGGGVLDDVEGTARDDGGGGGDSS